MLKFKILILLLIFLSGITVAQNKYTVDPVNGVTEYTITAYGILEDEYKGAEGSPYLDKDFTLGTITSGNKVTNALMRYNIYFEEIETTNSPDSKDISALRKDSDLKITIGRHEFLYVLKGQGTEQRGKYFQILQKGAKFDLLKENNIRYIKPRVAKTSIEYDKPGKFEKSGIYYLVSKQGRFIQLPEKKKDFLKFFNHHQDSMEKYIKENRIKLSNDEDMATLIGYYNSL